MGDRSRNTGKRRLIENALHRLGVYTGARQVVEELARQEVRVTEEEVWAVRIEMLSGGRGLRTRRAVPPGGTRGAGRHSSQKKPPRRR